jgi:hypothetical protein
MGNLSNANADLATERGKNEPLPGEANPGREKKRPAGGQHGERDKNDATKGSQQRREPSPSDLFNGS